MKKRHQSPKAATFKRNAWKPDPFEVERFAVYENGKTVVRRVSLRRGGTHAVRIGLLRRISKRASQEALAAAADLAYLRRKRKSANGNGRAIRTVDLFSSCGFMSQGAADACQVLGKRFAPVLAVELKSIALDVYKENFSPKRVECCDIRKLMNGRLGARRTKIEKRFLKGLGEIQLALGGPPCQGHSDLNNYTRRADPKNSLYNRMARFAELAKPKHIVIENVQAAVHAKSRVVQKTINRLRELGYHVDSGLVEVRKLGVPQGRRRHIVVASLTKKIVIAETIARYERQARTTGWAIGDLLNAPNESVFDRASMPTKRNQKRIDYLFRHRLYDLPNSMRPKCHKKGDHSYKSVYGRLRWNRPAQTITTGFGSMGQGRFVHPRRRRTLTPHEAARIQFIPDHFKFDGTESKKALAEMIGNGVPPKLTYIFVLELLR
jgi:DNA (cytosine-5)-methyltransferase 1